MLIDLSYLRYPLPPDVQRLFEAGEFAHMERVIAKRLADPRTPEALKKRMTFQLAIAQQIPRDYPHTRSALLKQLQERIRDFTPEELEELRDDGTLDWRYVEGECRFKSNAVNNLCKTSREYRSRIIDQESVAQGDKERAELDSLIARMKEKGHMRARFTMHEEITVDSFDAVAAWLYADGKTPQRLAQLYADDEYLAEELRGKNPSQDTDKVRMITDALVNGESLAVKLSDRDQNDSYESRLLSVKYPGLYYSVWFFTDAFGKCYLHDYASDKTVEAPSVIAAWIIGGGTEV